MPATSTLPVFPRQVYQFVRAAFRSANRRLCAKLASVPNCPEESLDLTLIEFLSNYAGPRVVAPDWTVRIDVHYLGGLRHFNRWEVGDIGALIFAKRAGQTVANKVALLQSKRLYPDKGSVAQLEREDFIIGFGTLLPSGGKEAPLAEKHSFPFTPSSRYKALKVDDDQYKAIRDYETHRRIPVHYLLYNPWLVPVTYSFPVAGRQSLGRMANGGARVAPASRLRGILSSKSSGYSPSFSDLNDIVSVKAQHASGWRLEHFMADLVLKCQQGRTFESPREDDISALFSRRSGPIAAAISVTVEQTDN
jgi:hypothetical protein